jgi:hypothetical protein
LLISPFFLFSKKYRLFKKNGDSMIKRLLLVVAVGVALSGCFMAPLALIGPMSSGFTTASIIQSGVTSGAGYIIKQASGKSVSEHVIEVINKDILQQAYAPKKSTALLIAP